MRIRPSIILIAFIFITVILSIVLTAVFMGVCYDVTFGEEASGGVIFSAYLMTFILWGVLYALKKGMTSKLLFIKFSDDGRMKVFDPISLQSIEEQRSNLRGFSKSDENGRSFYRLYFNSGIDITLLFYYTNFNKLEDIFTSMNIPLLGTEFLRTDFLGKPIGQKF